MKPDVIICHPRDVLYPLWMKCMNKDRHLFNKVIVVMTQQSNDWDFTNYIKDKLINAEIIESYPYDGTDWRNSAINEALKHTTGDVLFLEQDFLYEEGFMENNLKGTKALREGDRVHPAFLLVERERLDKTDKDFSVNPDKGDHFSKFTSQLSDIENITGDYYHLNGLTQNYRLDDNWYQPSIFKQYNEMSIELPQHNTWKQFCIQKKNQMENVEPHETINLERFFK